MLIRKIGLSFLLVAFVLTLGACGGSSETQGDSGGTAASSSPLNVYAAASLTEAFPKIDPSARYNFAGSDDLAAQITEGAPADVYAAASSKYPQDLYGKGLVEKSVTFASNRLVLIVPEDNPANIQKVDDVAKPGTKLVIAAEGVPVGDYAREVLDNLGLSKALDNVVSEEDDVKGVVSKVAVGDADAGFVYITDSVAAGADVKVIDIPMSAQPPIEYQIAVVSDSKNKAGAEAFIQKVTSPEGQQVLKDAGFIIP